MFSDDFNLAELKGYFQINFGHKIDVIISKGISSSHLLIWQEQSSQHFPRYKLDGWIK